VLQEFAVIEDGYNAETVISRVPGLHPRVWLKFRPALHEERMELRDSTARAGLGAAMGKLFAEFIGEHVVSWDIKLSTKKEVDPKAVETVRKLQPELLDKILDIVCGRRPLEEATDAKNSSAGSGS
jgi:hypothetical protein